MRLRLTTTLSAAGLLMFCVGAQAAPLESSNQPVRPDPFLEKVGNRSFTVDGTILSTRGGSLVVRIDDHGHQIPFSLGSGVSGAKLQAGSRVSVRYHPAGATGQVADEVQVLSGPRGAGIR